MLPIFNNSETNTTLGEKSYFSAMVIMAEIDGPICKQEKRILFNIADKLEVTEEEFVKLLYSPYFHKLEFFNSDLNKIKFLFDLFEIIYSDGAINDKELKLLHSLVVQIGFNPSKATKIISRSLKVFQSKIDFDIYYNSLMALF